MENNKDINTAFERIIALENEVKKILDKIEESGNIILQILQDKIKKSKGAEEKKWKRLL